MIVGEPSLMGGEMDDEDERYITRLENSQYEPNNPASSHPPPQYLSPTHQMPPSFPPQQPNPNLQSLLHQKQQFIPNSPLMHPNQMKREQMSFPGSPQQPQQLPSMFSAGGPPTPNTNVNSNVFPPPSTPVNGDSTAGGKRTSIASLPGNTSTTTNNSSSSPPTPSSTNHNQVRKSPAKTFADSSCEYLFNLLFGLESVDSSAADNKPTDHANQFLLEWLDYERQ